MRTLLPTLVSATLLLATRSEGWESPARTSRRSVEASAAHPDRPTKVPTTWTRPLKNGFGRASTTSPTKTGSTVRSYVIVPSQPGARLISTASVLNGGSIIVSHQDGFRRLVNFRPDKDGRFYLDAYETREAGPIKKKGRLPTSAVLYDPQTGIADVVGSEGRYRHGLTFQLSPHLEPGMQVYQELYQHAF